MIATNIIGIHHHPSTVEGLECFIVADGRYAGAYRFRDAPRHEIASFIQHLKPCHSFDRAMIVSGDRESEVRYLADRVGISEVAAQKPPEEKVAIVRDETRRARIMLRLGRKCVDGPEVN